MFHCHTTFLKNFKIIHRGFLRQITSFLRLIIFSARISSVMRSGFGTQVFDARDVHWVDPTGTPERELADKWRARAEATEQEGFARFANEIGEAAASYDQEAERIVREHSKRN